MKKLLYIIVFGGIVALGFTGCSFDKNTKESGIIQSNTSNTIDVEKKLNTIVENGPQTSSNPFQYIEESKEEYTELLNNPKETFEYSIKDLIESNASKGLKSYLEALLCSEINKDFKYDFESAPDYLEHYKEFLSDSIINDYDLYAVSLLKQD